MEPFLGQIQAFGFNFAPMGWAFCNGQIMSIAQNSALFALLGTTYGGDGQVTFALPNLQGRSIVHQGQGPGLTNKVIGELAGNENITLLSTNLPQHNHVTTIAVHTVDGEEPSPTGKIAMKKDAFNEDPSAGSFLANGAQSSIAGNNQPMAIRNPYLGVYHSIALEGIFPSRN